MLLIVSLQIAEPASNRDPSFCSRGAEDDLGLSLAFSLTSNTAIIQGPTSVYTRMDIRDIWTIFTWHRLAEGEVNIASRRRYARGNPYPGLHFRPMGKPDPRYPIPYP